MSEWTVVTKHKKEKKRRGGKNVTQRVPDKSLKFDVAMNVVAFKDERVFQQSSVRINLRRR